MHTYLLRDLHTYKCVFTSLLYKKPSPQALYFLTEKSREIVCLHACNHRIIRVHRKILWELTVNIAIRYLHIGRWYNLG
jgi:hypothetical protein